MVIYLSNRELGWYCKVMFFKKISILSMAFMVSACVGSNNEDVLQSAIQPQTELNSTAVTPNAEVSPFKVGSISQIKPNVPKQPNIAFASDEPTVNQLQEIEPEPLLPPPPPPRVKKTYLINGLGSSVGAIGYGFTNLAKKIPGATLHNYTSFVESSTLIRTKVSKQIQAAYKADPTVEINLIGISFGANIVTWIAEELHRKDIPINYLATLEGPAMSRIHENVRLADNFSCTGLSCFRTSSRLSWGNKETEFSKFKIKAGHIDLADHPQVHNRVLYQINRPPEGFEIPQLSAQ